MMFQALTDTVKGALRTLSANKLRSALTLLGIVIGVVAVVAMAATTVGLRRAISDDLEQLGSGVFQVQKQPVFGNHHDPKYEKRKNFTLADVSMLQSQCTSCLRVGGETWSNVGNVSALGVVSRTNHNVIGGTAEFFDNNGYALAAGRLFNEAEATHGAELAVLGAAVVDDLFPNEDPLGQVVRIRNHAFRVVGTLARRGSTLGGSMDDLIVMPVSTFLVLFGTKRSLNITIQARDPQRIGVAQDEVVSLLRRARGVPPEDENDFELFSNQSVQETFDNVLGAIAAASIGICAIALLIGGIGVMNIMLVAVTERTSEIGLRRALGARRRRILLQFVFEAVVLTSMGGLLGVLIGTFLAYLIKVLVDIPTLVPMWAVGLSMLTAGGTGLVFGIYPAYRASRLDPVEAMRHE